MNILLIEILACLIATAFLSLFIGWVVRGTIAQKEVKAAGLSWESKLSELELRHKQDTEHLEDQVDRLDSESNQLAHRNDSINASLRENEISVNQARADAIELNRKQSETLERLQRIISQKDEELKYYKENAAKFENTNVQTARAAGGAGISNLTALTAESAEAKIASLSAKRAKWEAERKRLLDSIGDAQQTVAIDPADLPTEPLDKTVKINQDQALDLNKRRAKLQEPSDVETDKTQMIDVDQTIVLDDMNGDNPLTPENKKPGRDDS